MRKDYQPIETAMKSPIAKKELLDRVVQEAEFVELEYPNMELCKPRDWTLWEFRMGARLSSGNSSVYEFLPHPSSERYTCIGVTAAMEKFKSDFQIGPLKHQGLDEARKPVELKSHISDPMLVHKSDNSLVYLVTVVDIYKWEKSSEQEKCVTEYYLVADDIPWKNAGYKTERWMNAYHSQYPAMQAVLQSPFRTEDESSVHLQDFQQYHLLQPNDPMYSYARSFLGIRSWPSVFRHGKERIRNTITLRILDSGKNSYDKYRSDESIYLVDCLGYPYRLVCELSDCEASGADSTCTIYATDLYLWIDIPKEALGNEDPIAFARNYFSESQYHFGSDITFATISPYGGFRVYLNLDAEKECDRELEEYEKNKQHLSEQPPQDCEEPKSQPRFFKWPKK